MAVALANFISMCFVNMSPKGNNDFTAGRILENAVIIRSLVECIQNRFGLLLVHGDVQTLRTQHTLDPRHFRAQYRLSIDVNLQFCHSYLSA